jgi:site-specific recombinase XerD
MILHDVEGRRLYLNADESRAFLGSAATADRPVGTLCTILHDIGCRISETLALASESIDLSGRAVMFESVKKRRHSYGVHAINSGMPLNMLSKWMAHAILEVTAIYANALGAEEQGIAARIMWDLIPSADDADQSGAFVSGSRGSTYANMLL